MVGIPISIGMQCTTASYFKEKGIRTKSFPFDWILSNPLFVLEMLKLLLKENMEIKKIVDEYFYVLDKKVFVDLNNVEHYTIVNDKKQKNKLNSKYDVIFPHDYMSKREEVIEKYVRRFQRLKELIMDKNSELDFYYISQSSMTGGNYTINGREVVTDVYENLKKIYNLIFECHGSKFRIIIFDALKVESCEILKECENIKIVPIKSEDKFFKMMPEILSKVI
jgi:hypothetical protein